MHSVPRGVLWGLGLSVVLGMIALIGFTIAIPDLKTVASAPLPLLATAGYWLPSWLVKVFVAFVVFSMFALPAPFHGSDKVLGYGLALAALCTSAGCSGGSRKAPPASSPSRTSSRTRPRPARTTAPGRPGR